MIQAMREMGFTQYMELDVLVGKGVEVCLIFVLYFVYIVFRNSSIPSCALSLFYSFSSFSRHVPKPQTVIQGVPSQSTQQEECLRLRIIQIETR